MNNEELDKFIYTDMKNILAKLSDEEVVNVLKSVSMAYQTGYNQALIDVDNLAIQVEDYNRAKNN